MLMNDCSRSPVIKATVSLSLIRMACTVCKFVYHKYEPGWLFCPRCASRLQEIPIVRTNERSAPSV